jgi:hypothetical protein
MATSAWITGLSGSVASTQEVLGATAVNRGFRIPALKVNGVAVGTQDDPFGDLVPGTRQKEVAVVPGVIYEVDIDNPETRKRLSKRHGLYGAIRGPWVEVPSASGVDLTVSANVTTALTNFVVRSLLTEGTGAVSQSFISRGTPIQNQDILFVGTDTEEDIQAGAVTLDLTKASERRALRLHAGAWVPARAADGLVTIRGLMTTKSAPASATGGYGLSSGRGFRIPTWENFNPSTTTSNLGYVSSTTSVQVDLTNANVRRALRRNIGRWIVVTAP